MFVCKPIFKILAAHFRTKGMLNHDNICMQVIHCVVIREIPPSKRPRIESSLYMLYRSEVSADESLTSTRDFFFLA